MSDESKAVVRRFIEGYQSGHNEQVALECLADDFVHHSPLGPFTMHCSRRRTAPVMGRDLSR